MFLQLKTVEDRFFLHYIKKNAIILFILVRDHRRCFDEVLRLHFEPSFNDHTYAYIHKIYKTLINNTMCYDFFFFFKLLT